MGMDDYPGAGAHERSPTRSPVPDGASVERAAFPACGFYAAGRLVAVLVDEDRDPTVAAVVQERLCRERGPRLLVLDMRHVLTTGAARWWAQRVNVLFAAGSELFAAHAPAGFTYPHAVVHTAHSGSPLPALRCAYQRVLCA